MLAELRPKSQITIPKSIVSSLNLKTGDKLEIFEKNGIIYIRPVVVCPKSFVDNLQSEVESIKADIAAGKKPVFDDVDSMFEALEN